MHPGAESVLERLSGANSLLADGALALMFVSVTWLWELNDPAVGVLPLALAAGVNLPLVLRRRLPFTVLALSCGVAFLCDSLGHHSGLNIMGPLLALYTVAVHRSARVSLAGAALALGLWSYAALETPGVPVWPTLGQSVIVVACAWAFGISVRTLAARNRRLADLVGRLRREQDDEARRAATRERVRIARELHDVVAHHMSVISVQAGLGRYVLHSDPPAAHVALLTIADTSREAMVEMRRLLSVLRIEDEDAEEDGHRPSPGLGRLEPLFERLRSAGMPVEVTVTGRAWPLPAGLDLCVYRIIQGCLTNVLIHAASTRVKVILAYGDTELEVRVTDDGRGTEAPGVSKSEGHGLIDMTERVRLYQGTITAGPRPLGGFEVVATFPFSS